MAAKNMMLNVYSIHRQTLKAILESKLLTENHIGDR